MRLCVFLKDVASSRRLINFIILVCVIVVTPFPIQTIAAPPTPGEPAITNPSEDKNTENPSGFLPPDLREFDEERAKAAINAALEKLTAAWGVRYQLESVQVALEGDWAVGSAGWNSKEKLFESPLTVLARKLTDGSWFAMTPDGSEEFAELLSEVPSNLLPGSEKAEVFSQIEILTDFGKSNQPLQLIGYVKDLGAPLPVGPGAAAVNRITATPTPSPDMLQSFTAIDRPVSELPPLPTPAPKSPMPRPNDQELNMWVEYWDERDGYGLAYPSDWVIMPAAVDALYSSTMLSNYKEPDGYPGNDFLDGAFNIDFNVHRSLIAAELSELITSYVENNREGDDPISIRWSPYSGVSRESEIFDVLVTNLKTSEQENRFLAKQLSGHKLLLISFFPKDSVNNRDVTNIGINRVRSIKFHCITG